jgi:hypothetical protein
MRFISRTIAEVIAISYRKCWGQEMAFSEGKGGGVRLRIALGYGAPTGEVLGETARLTDTHAGFETHARKALHSSDPHRELYEQRHQPFRSFKKKHPVAGAGTSRPLQSPV